MDINYIKSLIKLVSENSVDELEIEENGNRIKIAKSKPESIQQQIPNYYSIPQQFPLPQQTLPTAPIEKQEEVQKNYKEIKSPIVGTFYRFPAPDAPPYVEVGSEIKSGNVLCIIEAMKLMNEIESEMSGKIVKILVENGKPVEFNQVLFLVEPL